MPLVMIFCLRKGLSFAMSKNRLSISILMICSILLAAFALPTATAAKYGDGTYLVGPDLEAGLYKVHLTDTLVRMGYIERLKGVSMSLDDVIANGIITGDGYLQIKDTDFAVRLQGVSISQITLSGFPVDLKDEVSDGVHLIGYDLSPGLYKVIITETTMNMGYVERLRGVSMEFSDIIDNSIFQGQGYVEIKPDDFAVRVQGAKLQKQQ